MAVICSDDCAILSMNLQSCMVGHERLRLVDGGQSILYVEARAQSWKNIPYCLLFGLLPLLS